MSANTHPRLPKSSKIISKIDKLLLVDGPRIKPLDGIRSIAITLVIFQHTYTQSVRWLFKDPLFVLPYFIGPIMRFGWVGVQLFFTLSGFLIGGIIYRKLRNNKFSINAFYMNRSLRILPACWFFFLVSSWSQIGFNNTTLSNFFYISNYTSNYFIYWSRHMYSLAHVWSLCVEEHFYLIFPLLFLFIFRRNRDKKVLISLISIIVVIFWITRLWYVFDQQIHTKVLLNATTVRILRESHFQIDYFLLGIIGAILYEHNLIPQTRLLSLLTWFLPICFLGLAQLNIFMKQTQSISYFFPYLYGFIYPLISLWCFLVVLMASTQKNLITKILSLSLFRYIAVFSYSIYLYHLFLIYGIHNRIIIRTFSYIGPDNPIIVIFLTIGIVYSVSILAASVSFFCIERPFLLLKRRRSQHPPKGVA